MEKKLMKRLFKKSIGEMVQGVAQREWVQGEWVQLEVQEVDGRFRWRGGRLVRVGPRFLGHFV